MRVRVRVRVRVVPLTLIKHLLRKRKMIPVVIVYTFCAVLQRSQIAKITEIEIIDFEAVLLLRAQ